MVLPTTSQWRTRIDPTSEIRFHNADGKHTRWIRGGELVADPEWISLPSDVYLLDYATSIEIDGLDNASRAQLAASRPSVNAELQTFADGPALMIASGRALDQWVWDFVDEREGWVGTWTFHFPQHPPIELSADALQASLERPTAARIGWRWQDVTGAEVRRFSGAKTLGAIVGTAAATVLVVPAVIGGGVLSMVGRTSGTRGRAAVSNLAHYNGGVRRNVDDWQPTLTDGQPAAKLFGSATRRRAMVQVVATAEASIDPFGADHIVEGGAAVVRLAQVFEIGAGGLHLASRDDNGFVHSGIAFARLGVHLPLDAAHRVAVPLAIDIGGGGGNSIGVFARLDWGLRVKVRDHAFVGVTPMSPTFIQWKDGSTRQRAGVMSGLELGLTW